MLVYCDSTLIEAYELQIQILKLSLKNSEHQLELAKIDLNLSKIGKDMEKQHREAKLELEGKKILFTINADQEN